jgi:membrane-bound inhibitor of C-type lysozyme
MSQGHKAVLAATALTLAMFSATPGRAMPATVDYQCSPALPKGDQISVDFNSGGKSITVEFPNGQSIRMRLQRSGSGFRYGTGNMTLYGKGDTVTLEIGGQPSRDCMTVRR